MRRIALFIWVFTPLFAILADADFSDSSGRPVARAQKVGNTVIYTDERGNLIGKEERQGDTIIYTDNTGKVTGRAEKVGDKMIYTNLDGRLVSQAENTGSITTYTDENGNITGRAENSGGNTVYTDEQGNTRGFRNSFPSSYDEITAPPEDLRSGQKRAAVRKPEHGSALKEEASNSVSPQTKPALSATRQPFYGPEGELLGSIVIDNDTSSYYDIDGNLLFTATKKRNVCTYRNAAGEVFSMAVTTGDTVSYYYPDGRIVTATAMPDGRVNYTESKLTGLAPAVKEEEKSFSPQPEKPPASQAPQRDSLIPSRTFDMTLEPSTSGNTPSVESYHQ